MLPEQKAFYEKLREQRANMYDYMEGADAEEFKRWESLFCAYDLIIQDMEEEAGIQRSEI